MPVLSMVLSCTWQPPRPPTPGTLCGAEQEVKRAHEAAPELAGAIVDVANADVLQVSVAFIRKGFEGG